MAFGIPPKYEIDYFFDNLSQTQFLVLALEAAKNFKWQVIYTHQNGFIIRTPFSLNSWGEEISVKIEYEKAFLKSECLGSQMVDWGKNKKNITFFILTINQLKSAFTPEELNEKYEALNLSANVEEDLLSQPKLTKKEKLANILSFLKPSKDYFITPILIYLNLVAFILLSILSGNPFSLSTESLIKLGGNFRPLTLGLSEWWRLVSCFFLHIDILHFLLNMIALFYIGTLLEPYLGKIRFIIAYLLTGLIASLTSTWWYMFTISVGASGAIFGMYGVFLAMLTTNLIEKQARQRLIIIISIFIVYNLLNGIRVKGVDNAAHIGGLISGLIIGYFYMPGLKNPHAVKLKYVTIGLLTLITCSVSIMFYKKFSNDIKEFNLKATDLASMEVMALEFYKLSIGTPKKDILYEIQDRGIYYWQQNIQIIKEIEQQLSLPNELHKRNKKILEYYRLRVKSYRFFYKMIDEDDTNKYQDSLLFYNKKIEAITSEIKEQENRPFAN